MICAFPPVVVPAKGLIKVSYVLVKFAKLQGDPRFGECATLDVTQISENQQLNSLGKSFCIVKQYFPCSVEYLVSICYPAVYKDQLSVGHPVAPVVLSQLVNLTTQPLQS